jgi:hypothetical protein
LLLEDWTHNQHKLADTEQRMTGVLDELGLTELVTSITGISAVGAAAILAETGDPTRFATARALVKHAGLAPREKLSGTFTGRTKLTGQGRPGLRLAAWRAVWGAQRTNTVYAARYRHLTTREDNKLTPTQAQTVIAAAILRHLHAMITTGRAWDPRIATHGTRRPAQEAIPVRGRRRMDAPSELRSTGPSATFPAGRWPIFTSSRHRAAGKCQKLSAGHDRPRRLARCAGASVALARPLVGWNRPFVVGEKPLD